VTKQKIALSAGVALVALWALTRRGLVASVMTSEGFDLSPYGGPTIYPDAIKRVAEAIAKQEGFYVAGSIPQRAHNPGDLKIPGWTGATLGSGISVFDSDGAGWTALYRQLWLILTGDSARYNLDMSIDDMARTWTATQQSAWAANVAGYLGVDTNTKLWAVLS
jgi:hypothetical protein